MDEYDIVKKIGKGKYAKVSILLKVRFVWIFLKQKKVYNVKRKDNNKYYAVKYLHKNKLASIEDAKVIN